MKKHLFTAIRLFLILTTLTGIIYPLFVTVISRFVFPLKSSGSLIVKENKIIGSALIGQKFTDNKYFWSRPSAVDYQPMPSGATNLAQSSSKLKNQYDERKSVFLEKNFLNSSSSIPLEMLFSSASGVDPHISPEAAFLQVERVAKARNFTIDEKNSLNKLIESLIEKPQMGFLGQPVINVLLLNLKVDKMRNTNE